MKLVNFVPDSNAIKFYNEFRGFKTPDQEEDFDAVTECWVIDNDRGRMIGFQDLFTNEECIISFNKKP
jgi:hypothetical protein